MTTHSNHPARALRATILLLALVSFAVALAGGCGGKKSADNAGGEAPAPPATPAPATPTPREDTTAAVPAVPVLPAGDLGAQVFAKRCMLCHGPDGHGDGAASKALNPKPRNFHDQAYMATRSDAQLLAVIQKGKGAMPKWEGQLSEAEIAAVLKHIRELGKKP